jgi:hypothetical protein
MAVNLGAYHPGGSSIPRFTTTTTANENDAAALHNLRHCMVLNVLRCESNSRLS